jgi:hypothetical protein
MTDGERPAERPCDTCRWRDGDTCTIRGHARGDTTASPRQGRGRPRSALDISGERIEITVMALPADRGASCPPGLWEPDRERWYHSASLMPESSIARCWSQPGLAPSECGQLHRMIAEAAARLGVPEQPTERRYDAARRGRARRWE